MGAIESVRVFGSAVLDIYRQVVKENADLPSLVRDGQQFNRDLRDLHSLIEKTDKQDPALSNFNKLVFQDSFDTVNGNSDEAVIAIDVPTVLRKLAGHAETVHEKFPHHPTAIALYDATAKMERNYHSFGKDSKAFIEKNTRRHNDVFPMQIMVDVVTEEAFKQNEAYQNLTSLGHDPKATRKESATIMHSRPKATAATTQRAAKVSGSNRSNQRKNKRPRWRP